MKINMKNSMLVLAILVLAVTFIFARNAHKMDEAIVQGYYQQMIPEASSFEPITDKVAKAINADGKLISYLGVEENVGYGGPMLVGSIIDQDGAIKDVVILEHKETPTYISKITKAGYFRQYSNKTVKDPLVLDHDIDRVSGATLSSRAIANSVNSVAHLVATQELNITPEKAPQEWQVGIKEIAVALIFVVSIFFARIKSLAKYRFHLLLASIAIMGFWLNRPLSMAHISSLFQGYFPAFSTNLIWYIVLIGAIVPALATGKNLYCHWVCPFCGLQEAAHLLSKTSLPIGKYRKLIVKMKDVILFVVLFLSFLLLNPSVSSFEPFGTLFGFNGSKYSWYLLFSILVASFFYRRFWCVAFCPVGTFLDKVAAAGRQIRNLVKSHPKESNFKNVKTVVLDDGE